MYRKFQMNFLKACLTSAKTYFFTCTQAYYKFISFSFLFSIGKSPFCVLSYLALVDNYLETILILISWVTD